MIKLNKSKIISIIYETLLKDYGIKTFYADIREQLKNHNNFIYNDLKDLKKNIIKLSEEHIQYMKDKKNG